MNRVQDWGAKQSARRPSLAGKLCKGYMDVLFLEAPFNGEIELEEETITHLKEKNYK